MKPVILLVVLLATLVGCSSDADMASRNLSKAADQFEVSRRIVFYNGITGGYMLSIEGLCSLGDADTAKTVSVTCKTGPAEYKKHFLGLSDNVTFFVEQIASASVNKFHYRVIFRPTEIIPSVELAK